MESSLVPQPRRPTLAIASFAFYGFWSLAQSGYLGGPMFGQAILYFAVAAALWKQESWAGWFAVGIAASGLVVDAVFLAAWGVDPGMTLDTVAQATLFWLALQVREGGATERSPDRLTSGAPAPIGWTFALAAGVLPPAVMGGLMPSQSCSLAPGPADSTLPLLLTVLLASVGLRLVARLRTVGLLVLVGGLVTAALATRESGRMASAIYFMGEYALEELRYVHPRYYMNVVAFAFALAALVPLGPRFVRAAFRR